MDKKKSTAKVIRMLTVPPILLIAFILILVFAYDGAVFRGADIGMTILLLGIVPILAYPLQQFVPAYRDKGRAGQRRFAFVLNLIGYGLALAYGLLSHASKHLLLIYFTYAISVVLLTACNAALPFHASGHLCSIATPMMLLIHFIGWTAVLPCLLLALLVGWSSIVLRRHTFPEIVSGLCIGVLGFLLACLIMAV